MVAPANVLDGKAQSVEPLEDRDDLHRQIFVHDQFATMERGVKTDVVELD
ncbi:hypothetical protein [Mycobacterium shottsii]|nr:hypothetical protein [Mycobacterium shottsii]